MLSFVVFTILQTTEKETWTSFYSKREAHIMEKGVDQTRRIL